MAERDEPVLHGELREMIQRLDERISSLERTVIDAVSHIRSDVQDMRADIRQVRGWIFMLYIFIIGVATAAVTIYNALPKVKG